MRFKIDEYYETIHWKNKSQETRTKVGRCQLCGSRGDLQVHHNTYRNIGKEEEYDLVVLCKSCHEKYHGILTEEELMW